LDADPHLWFGEAEPGHWMVRDRATGQEWTSPLDDPEAQPADVAYVGRVPRSSGQLVVVAGIHAIGSVGAVDWLTTHLAELHRDVGERPFSMLVRSEHDGLTITGSEVTCPPRIY
jgi:hypothetical protein